MNLDDLLFGQDQMTVREQLYKNSHRGAGNEIKLRLSLPEREGLVKMFQKSQMEQNVYKMAYLTLENPMKMRQIAELFASYKSVDIGSFSFNGSPKLSLRMASKQINEDRVPMGGGLQQDFNIKVKSKRSNNLITQALYMGEDKDSFNKQNKTPIQADRNQNIMYKSFMDQQRGASTGWNNEKS